MSCSRCFGEPQPEDVDQDFKARAAGLRQTTELLNNKASRWARWLANLEVVSWNMVTVQVQSSAIDDVLFVYVPLTVGVLRSPASMDAPVYYSKAEFIETVSDEPSGVNQLLTLI